MSDNAGNDYVVVMYEPRTERMSVGFISGTDIDTVASEAAVELGVEIAITKRDDPTPWRVRMLYMVVTNITAKERYVRQSRLLFEKEHRDGDVLVMENKASTRLVDDGAITN